MEHTGKEEIKERKKERKKKRLGNVQDICDAL
jgi:hypothetical protein